MTGTNAVNLVLRIAGDQSDIRATLARQLERDQGKLTVSGRLPTVGNRPEAWWYIEDESFNQESTEPRISLLLQRLSLIVQGDFELLRSSGLVVELDCTVTIQEMRPMIEISADSIALLNELRASVSIEVYDSRGQA